MIVRLLVGLIVLASGCVARSLDRAGDAAASSGGYVDAADLEHSAVDASVNDVDSSQRDSGIVTGHEDGGMRDTGIADTGSLPPDAGLSDAGLPSVIRIATFNLQNFGPTKAGRPDDVATYVAAIRRYDLVAIQEIQHKTGDAARALLVAVNAEAGPEYGMLLSDNTGRESDDQTSQERYAYLYNTQVVTALGDGALFDDSKNDLFQREPFVARFEVGTWDFTLVTVHTRPQSALAEIGALHAVIGEARAQHSDDDVITLGDYNASCDYASTQELDGLELRDASDYLWIVPDDADTNVAARVCAYDRIVATSEAGERFNGEWGVDNITGDVSDHYPVWAAFEITDR